MRMKSCAERDLSRSLHQAGLRADPLRWTWWRLSGYKASPVDALTLYR